MIPCLLPTLGCESLEARGPAQVAEKGVGAQGGVLGRGLRRKWWKLEMAVEGTGRRG